jgi:hypothetical protein
MRRIRLPIAGVAACAAALCAMLAAGGATALASPPVCAGASREAPGLLAGQFNSGVVVEGFCAVNGGPAVVRGRLTITSGSTFAAAFALNDRGGTNPSRLTVYGDVVIQPGATVFLGCDPQSSPCFDEPNGSSRTRIFGNLTSREPFSVIVHNSIVAGNVSQTGGGGGITCFPEGGEPFSNFSAYEDSTVRGSVSVTGLESCWLGLARLRVAGNVKVINDQLSDADAIEILSNTINGNLTCRENRMVWNSSEAEFEQEGLFPRTEHRNTVIGKRNGQCVLASPLEEGGSLGPGPF